MASKLDVTYKSLMARTQKTAFDKFFDEQMAAPGFAKAYTEARAEVDAIDRIVRAIDEARVQRDMTKADLARVSGIRPELVRRLFTADSPNPTLDTVVRLMAAVGCTLDVVKLAAPPARRVKKGRGRVAAQGATLRGARARNSAPSRRTSA
ncbi:MAG: helix-turn-helix domain-containing protein [Polyangiales bacterium]